MPYTSKTDGYARNSGKRWRRDDLSALRELVRRGAPLRLISLRLGRPDAAIRSKASDLGLSVSQGDAVVAPPPSRTLSRNRTRGPIPEPSLNARQLELFGTA